MNYIAKKIALQEKNILNHADLYLDYNNRIAFHKNRKINLTVKEFDILFFLASYPGQVFTHRQIYETVWGKEYFCDEGNVTAHIGHIRKKIELDPRNPVFIQTVRGIGYKSNLIILRHSLLHLRDQTSQSPCLHYADHPYDRRSLKACYISQVDLSLRG